MNDIDAYLAANRDQFTRDALTERLVAGGHDPAAVEAAWARLEADGPDEPGSSGGRILGVVLLLAVIAGYLYIGFYGILGIGFNASYPPYGAEDRTASGGIIVIAIVYVVAMLVGLAYSGRRIWRASRSGDVAGGLGVALVVAGGLLIGINGLCVVGNIAYAGLR